MPLNSKIKKSKPYRILIYVYQKIRQYMSFFINIKKVYVYRVNRNLFKLTNDERKLLTEIKKNGCLIHLNNNQEFNQAIQCLAEKLEIYLEKEEYIDRSNINDFNHKDKIRLINPTILVPEILKLAFDDSLIRLMSAYKGFIPNVVINCYKTLPYTNTTTPTGSSNFHRDDHGDFSVFIYLHDITTDHGASIYIKKSHGYTLKSTNLVSNYEYGHESSLKDPGYSEGEILKYYPASDFFRSTAEKGSIVFLDVTGIHKGPYWRIDSQNNKPRSVVHIVYRQKNFLKSGYTPNIPIERKHYEQLSELGKIVADSNCRVIE